MSVTKAGLLKTTLIDYPGKIACSVFLPGCNLRCPFCHNRELVLGTDDSLITLDEILGYISKRKNILQGVCITGGEPLIHTCLPDLVKEIRAMGLKIKIDTNGLLTDKILENSPDYIAMDIKTSPEKYHLLAGSSGKSDMGTIIRESVKTVMKSGINYEFRTTLVPGIVDMDDMEIIADIAKGCMKYTLNRFRPQNTLDSSYSEITPYTEDKYQGLAAVLEKNGIHAVFRGF